VRKADNLPPSCAVVTKSGNLNFLEPSGPVQACNGTALPLHYIPCSYILLFGLVILFSATVFAPVGSLPLSALTFCELWKILKLCSL